MHHGQNFYTYYHPLLLIVIEVTIYYNTELTFCSPTENFWWRFGQQKDHSFLRLLVKFSPYPNNFWLKNSPSPSEHSSVIHPFPLAPVRPRLVDFSK